MRAVFALLALVGCGPVMLGDEAETLPLDAGAGLDAAATIDVVVTVRGSGGCTACFELLAQGVGGRGPYSFEWEDGLRAAARTVCPGASGTPISVVAQDADGLRSDAHIALLESSDASCPLPPPQLCLQNPSFEGTPTVNTGSAGEFDALPWSACSNPSMTNVPDVVNDTIPQTLAAVPKASDGMTFLGLPEGQQASQRLCESIEGGSTVSLQLDASRIYIGGDVVPDTELAFLELWGGVASACSQRELLWASPPLSRSWQTYCVELRPQQFTDNLTLRANSNGALPTLIYVIVDHLVPVSRCP
ncbi:MAG: hypothetical protein JWN04_3800 [Myxococcaceae bacterium]|nr:hypothetical protein [Myxococcaceae bacterium]